jgi:transposase
MEELRPRVGGLDVHKDSVVACARVPGPDGRRVAHKQRFASTTAGIAALAHWLAGHEVTTVAMEATGVYWKPVYYGLEGLFDEVILCNAHHVKNVPGRKTDMADAEWLADIAAHGLVRASFVPPPPIRELRELTRYRKTQVDIRAHEIQRLEKVLQDAGIKLSSVASKVLTASGRAMVEALIAGERDPEVLSELAKGRMRPKRDRLTEALAGHFGAHHAAVAARILAHIDFLDETIDALTSQIVQRTRPFDEQLRLLCQIPGIGPTTAEAILAETGGDMSRFPSARHLAAWAGVAPASHESAGKRRAAGTRHGAPWLRRYLIEAARSAARTKGTYLSAQYWRIAGRRGPNKAAMAVAHSMVVAVWHVLANNQPYLELGGDYFQRRHGPETETRRLVRKLEALGHQVEISPAA